MNIESFEDPKVKGVTLYISNFERPLADRLKKDFFSDPSDASVTCAKTGPISIADNIAIGKGGEVSKTYICSTATTTKVSMRH